MGIKQNLVNEFTSELEELGKMNVGDEDYKAGIYGVTELADRIIELEKIEHADSEINVKWEAQNTERELKLMQMKQEHRDQMIRNGIEVAKVVGGFGLATWAFVASMNFEKEGTLTTEGGRTALKSLLKFMK